MSLLFLETSIPIAVVRCVFPVPGVLKKIIFSFLFKNSNVQKFKIYALLSDGWESNSKSSMVLIKGKCDTFIAALYTLSFLNLICDETSESIASKNPISLLLIFF